MDGMATNIFFCPNIETPKDDSIPEEDTEEGGLRLPSKVIPDPPKPNRPCHGVLPLDDMRTGQSNTLILLIHIQFHFVLKVSNATKDTH